MDLSTTYLGFTLSSPLMPGASPMVDDLDRVRRLEDAGASAIVMHSLFEEQLVSEQISRMASIESHADSSGEASSYLVEPPDFNLGPDEYLEQVRLIRGAVKVPVIASLNGSSAGGWLEYAKLIQQAGASAIELNVYFLATDAAESGGEVDQRVVDVLATVRKAVTIPLAVKLSPFHSSISNLARRLDGEKADGLVLFNRFYQPDINIEELQVERYLQLSDSSELPLRLRWLAILSGRLRASLAVSGGVHSGFDAIKAIMTGAHAIQVVSALLRHGPEYLRVVREEMVRWMEDHEYESIAQMRGSMSLIKTDNPAAYERANYMHILQTWKY